MLFLDPVSAMKGFKPKEFSTDFMQNPNQKNTKSQINGAQSASFSAAGNSKQQAAKQQFTSNKSVDVRLELSKNFFKKLQRLDLIEEC